MQEMSAERARLQTHFLSVNGTASNFADYFIRKSCFATAIGFTVRRNIDSAKLEDSSIVEFAVQK